MDGKYDFEDALNKCNNEEDQSANVDDYKENIANLLTLAKLRNYIGDSGNLTRSFHHKVRLNAFKYNGHWWAIHQFQQFKLDRIQNYCNEFANKAIKLGTPDFALFPNFDFENQGRDYSTLVYNPQEDSIELVSHKHKYNIVCTHKRMEKSGTVPLFIYVWVSDVFLQWSFQEMFAQGKLQSAVTLVTASMKSATATQVPKAGTVVIPFLYFPKVGLPKSYFKKELLQ